MSLLSLGSVSSSSPCSESIWQTWQRVSNCRRTAVLQRSPEEVLLLLLGGHRDANREWEKIGFLHLSLHLPHPSYPAPCQQSTVHFLRKKMWLRDLPSAPLYFFCSFAFQWLQPLPYNPSCTLALPSKRFAQQPKEIGSCPVCVCWGRNEAPRATGHSHSQA